ncbi:MAG: methyl-accepting chemotaxis protein [Cellvibrionaceae bacterium]
MLRSITIRSRIILLCVVSLLGLLALGMSNLMILKDELFEFKKDSVRSITRVGHSTIEYFYDQYTQGNMSESEAKSKALEMIRTIRYDADNYINVFDEGMTCVASGRKGLEGVNFSAIKDKAGNLLVPNGFKATENAEGEGFNYYVWPRPGMEVAEEKYSFNKKFEPWGWLLATGDYSDQIIKVVDTTIKLMWGLIGIAGFAVFILSYLVWHSIVNPLGDTVKVMNKVSSDTIDLTQTFDESGKDELTILAVKFNEYQQRMGTLIESVAKSSASLMDNSRQLTEITNGTSQGAIKQEEDMTRLMSSMRDMSIAIADVAQNTAQAAENTQSAREQSDEGSENINTAIDSVSHLSDKIDDANDTLSQLVEDTSEIDKVLEVINSIAEQTNLLALNAAIEAARAGEQGRGFAVVADEVRVLAQKVQDSTREIEQIIQRIHGGAKSAADSMEGIVSSANTTTELSKTAGETLSHVSEAVITINDLNMRIAASAEEQSSTTDEISHHTEDMHNFSQDVVVSVKRTKEAADALASLAQDMEQGISSFKLQ